MAAACYPKLPERAIRPKVCSPSRIYHTCRPQASQPAARRGSKIMVMRLLHPGLASILFPLLTCVPGGAGCIPFSEASQHVGETRCVKGKVLNVGQGNGGTTFLDFCQDYKLCSFTVVIFAGNLRDVGDVHQLVGKEIEIHGPIKMYDGRAEIILQRLKQLSGEAALIPPLPKQYDVEKKGRYSAGKFSRPSSRKPAKKRQPGKVPTEEQVDPMASED
jgi:hypothetical protein